jgi:hypothetical protein
MVYNIATIGLSVTAVMFGDFFSMIDVATGVNELGHEIALSQRQVKRLATDQRLAIRGAAFKATPAAPVRLTFRTDLD